MKKAFVTIAIIILLSGCQLFQSSTYDPNEYAGFIRVLTLFQKAHDTCAILSISEQRTMLALTDMIDYELDYLIFYARYRMIDNESTVEILNTIHDTNNELHERYKGDNIPSTIYCKTKTSILIEQATAGAEAMQQKVRK